MAHPDDIYDPLMIRHVDADESAAEALARWQAEDRLGPMREDAPMLADLRLVDLWNDLAGITAKSSDGSAGVAQAADVRQPDGRVLRFEAVRARALRAAGQRRA